MSPLAELFPAAGEAFDRIGAGWYLFGAQAAILHGAARLTANVMVRDTLTPPEQALDRSDLAPMPDEVLRRAAP